MKIKLTLSLLTAVLAILITGCGEDKRISPLNSRSIRGSGIMATNSRTVSEFNELVFSAAGRVNVTFGTPRSVSVTVDNNIMPYIATVLNEGRLDIRFMNGIDAVDYDLIVNVVVPNLSAIELKGAGSIVGNNLLQTNSLDLALPGTGTISLEIEATSLYSVFSGPGTVTLAGSVYDKSASCHRPDG